MIQNIERRIETTIVRSNLGTSMVHKCTGGMILAFKKGKEARFFREL